MYPLKKPASEYSASPKLHRTLSSALLILSAYSMAAAQQPPQQTLSGRRGPPPEAFSACEALAAGDNCSVVLSDVTISGFCAADRGRMKRGSGGRSQMPEGPPPNSRTNNDTQTDATRPPNSEEPRLLCIPEGHSRPPRPQDQSRD